MTALIFETVKAFALCAAGVALYSMLLKAPRRAFWPASILSGAGFALYKATLMLGAAELLAYFFGSMLISAGAEWLARRLKTPVTVFLFPGILPLVPGFGLYLTMLNLLSRDYEQFIQTGATTFFIAGVIVVSVVLTGTAARRIVALSRRHAAKQPFANKK